MDVGFPFCWVRLRSGIAGLYGNFSFLKNCQIFFHSGSTVLTFPSAVRRFSSPHIVVRLVTAHFLDNHPGGHEAVSCDTHFPNEAEPLLICLFVICISSSDTGTQMSLAL